MYSFWINQWINELVFGIFDVKVISRVTTLLPLKHRSGWATVRYSGFPTLIYSKSFNRTASYGERTVNV